MSLACSFIPTSCWKRCYARVETGGTQRFPCSKRRPLSAVSEADRPSPLCLLYPSVDNDQRIPLILPSLCPLSENPRILVSKDLQTIEPYFGALRSSTPGYRLGLRSLGRGQT